MNQKNPDCHCDCHDKDGQDRDRLEEGKQRLEKVKQDSIRKTKEVIDRKFPNLKKR